MSASRVSFIVPLHNGLELTQAMLASLEATLPAGLECEAILVDNGSTDGTRDWLRSLENPDIRVVLNERNLGYAAANNLAAAAAHGEFLAFLNNDLVFLPGWLQPMLDASALPGIGIVGNVQLSVRTRLVDHAGVFFDRAGHPFHFRPPVDFLATHPVLRAPAATGACMVTRRAVFTELGGFDEGYGNGYEDIDLCLRAAAKGHGVAVAAQSAVYHYIGASDDRHENDEANAERFSARWREVALKLAEIEPPVAGNEEGAAGGTFKLPFDPGKFATLQVFHPAPGGHSEQASSVHLYPTSSWTRVRIPLPSGVVSDNAAVRLDPCNGRAAIRLASLTLRERKSGREVWLMKPSELSKALEAGGTSHIAPENDRWLTLVSTGPDPHLMVRPESIPAWLSGRLDLELDLWLNTVIEK